MKKAEVIKTPTFNKTDKGKIKELTFKISLWLFTLIFIYEIIVSL